MTHVIDIKLNTFQSGSKDFFKYSVRSISQLQGVGISPMKSDCKPGGALLTNVAKEKGLVVFKIPVTTYAECHTC